MAEPAWLGLNDVRESIQLAKDWGVAEVASSRGGFGPAFLRAKGDPDKLGRRTRDGQAWRDVRNAFVARHMAQVRQNGEALFTASGDPTPRLVALAVWAHVPSRQRRRYITWLRRNR